MTSQPARSAKGWYFALRAHPRAGEDDQTGPRALVHRLLPTPPIHADVKPSRAAFVHSTRRALTAKPLNPVRAL